jgi:predicted cation transporter
MAETEKPFICYKSGLGFKITPRNAAGWRAFGLWMAAFAIGMGAWMALVTRPMAKAAVGYLTAGFLILTLIWVLAMARWMYVRSEVVDMNELLKLREELKRKKDKRR